MVKITVSRLTVPDLWDDRVRASIDPVGQAAGVEYGRHWNPSHFFGHWMAAVAENRGFFFVATG